MFAVAADSVQMLTSGVLVGYSYVAPEVVAGKAYTVRADIFSVGAVTLALTW